MANPEHLDKLKQAVETWNKWVERAGRSARQMLKARWASCWLIL
jgi:hypothetical protein